MFGAVVLGMVLGRLRFGLVGNNSETLAAEDEDSDSIHQTATPSDPFAIWAAVRLLVGVLLLWLTPLLISYLFVDDFHFWAVLVLFFTKTAFVTVGGSYGNSLCRTGGSDQAAVADVAANDGRVRAG
jgi:chromate transporter